MSAPPIPPPFEHLGHRAFAFYPSIVGVDHNEWRYKKATWSEVLVMNTKSGEEIWIPRRFLGELASIEEPVMIWGLTKELELKMGAVVPHVRRVIEMPRAVNDVPRAAAIPPGPMPAPVVNISLENRAENRIGRLIGAMLLLGITLAAVVVGVYRSVTSGRTAHYRPVMQSTLGLTAADDYFSVVRKLGTPSSDRWRDETGEVQYRLLEYPDKFALLMGRERNKAVYIGAMDREWRVIDSVELPGGVRTYTMLVRLRRF